MSRPLRQAAIGEARRDASHGTASPEETLYCGRLEPANFRVSG
jgi:hypothetical protein